MKNSFISKLALCLPLIASMLFLTAWYGPVAQNIWSDRIPIQIKNNGVMKSGAPVVLQFKNIFGNDFNYDKINFNSIRLTDENDNLVSFDYEEVSVPIFSQDIVKNNDIFKGNDILKFFSDLLI